MDRVTKEAGAMLGAGAACDTVKRSPTWDECGIEEKVERIRRELRQQREVATYGAKSAAEALDLAKAHQHGARGEVLKPVDKGRNYAAVARSIESLYDPLR